MPQSKMKGVNGEKQMKAWMVFKLSQSSLAAAGLKNHLSLVSLLLAWGGRE
jgi:hypothetical protein